jgi:hypothetical protein
MYHRAISPAPATGAFALFFLRAQLLAYGYLSISDSDGLTYAFDGTKITHGGTGAKGLGNPFAWIRFRRPVASGGTQEFTVQFGANPTQARIKTSAANKFGGGSPGPTQTPSATDEIVVFGGGTDAAPVFWTLFDPDGTYQIHTIVEDAQASSFGFAFITYLFTSVGPNSTQWWSDPLGSGVDLIQGPDTPHLLATLEPGLLDIGGNPPVISNVDPPVGSRVPRERAISIDVTDNLGALRAAILVGKFAEAQMVEVIHDGTAFTYHYQALSTRSVITNGYRYSVRRDTGWPGNPEITGYFVDTSGNENV